MLPFLAIYLGSIMFNPDSRAISAAIILFFLGDFGKDNLALFMAFPAHCFVVNGVEGDACGSGGCRVCAPSLHFWRYSLTRVFSAAWCSAS